MLAVLMIVKNFNYRTDPEIVKSTITIIIVVSLYRPTAGYRTPLHCAIFPSQAIVFTNNPRWVMTSNDDINPRSFHKAKGYEIFLFTWHITGDDKFIQFY